MTKEIKRKNSKEKIMKEENKTERKRKKDESDKSKTSEPNNSGDSPNAWSTSPKEAVNIEDLLQRARAISQQVRDNGLLFNSEERYGIHIFF